MKALTKPGTTAGRLLLKVASRVRADSSCRSSARNQAPVPLEVASFAQKRIRIKPSTVPAATTYFNGGGGGYSFRPLKRNL